MPPSEVSTAAPSQLSAFVRFCEERIGADLSDPAALQDFSARDFRRFWACFLEWSAPLVEGPCEPVCTDDLCERAEFFPGLRLNYAENLLRFDGPGGGEVPAVIAHHPSRPPERLTRADLRAQVSRLAGWLRESGVGPGDRVAAIAGNNPQAVVGALASAAVGATFSSASPDMGAPAILSRFEQLEPAVLLANLEDGEAASTALSDRVGEVARALPSLRAVVALDGGRVPQQLAVPVHPFADLMSRSGAEAAWERFPFNHPLFVLFTSGTTGRPKCIVHGAGGTLLEHLKEHRLHCDLGPADRLFFHTSTAWMMWNWQLSALATGAAIVLRDGPLGSPGALWQLAEEERVTVFGTSPPYLQLCQDSGYSPREHLSPGALRSVLSTGSILHDRQFDWVAEHVGDLPLQSISGGTDIVGCFVLGHPELPVRRGYIQCRSLGLDVQAYPTDAADPGSGVGELVCRNPFPSRPLGFLGDTDGSGFHEAYFAQNPGVWTHGDLIEFDPRGQARMHGRSDGVLNVRGLRIGPAEIHRALSDVAEVTEAMAIQPALAGDEDEPRLVLLLVLREDAELDGRLALRIRREIARYATPVHVPELLVAVDELPLTHSGKRSERAAREAASGTPVRNVEALRNPESLAAIRRAVARAVAAHDELAELGHGPEHGTTLEVLTWIWEGVLGVAPLTPEDNFFDAGGTSLAAVRVLQRVLERFGVELPPSTLLEAPTLAELAAVVDGPAAGRFPPLVKLREGDESRPLFVVHALHGDVLFFRPIALRLRDDRAVYGLQARGLDPRVEPHATIQEMAATYVETVRAVQPRGPYALAGYSLGGLIAYEMARRLDESGEDVWLLALIEARLPDRCLPPHQRWRHRVGIPVRVARGMIDRSRPRPQYLRRAVRRVAPWAPVAAPESAWGELPRRLEALEPIHRRAFAAYGPAGYAGDALLLLGEAAGVTGYDPTPVWRRLVAGSLRVEQIPGRHGDVIDDATVEAVAELLSRVITAEAAPASP